MKFHVWSHNFWVLIRKFGIPKNRNKFIGNSGNKNQVIDRNVNSILMTKHRFKVMKMAQECAEWKQLARSIYWPHGKRSISLVCVTMHATKQKKADTNFCMYYTRPKQEKNKYHIRNITIRWVVIIVCTMYDVCAASQHMTHNNLSCIWNGRVLTMSRHTFGQTDQQISMIPDWE